MLEASGFFVGVHDFTAFASDIKSVKNPVRNVEELSINPEGAFIHFDFKANAFLHGMIRTIVGTLLNVGRGKFTSEEVKDILESKDRAKAGTLAPPQGLCLMEVGY